MQEEMPGKGCCTNQPVTDLLSCYTSFTGSAVLLVKADTQYVEFPKQGHTAGSNIQNDASYLTFSAHLLLVHTPADCIHTDRTTTCSNYDTCMWCQIFPKVEASNVGQWEDNDLNFTTKVTLFDECVSGQQGYDGMDRMLPQSTQTLHHININLTWKHFLMESARHFSLRSTVEITKDGGPFRSWRG